MDKYNMDSAIIRLPNMRPPTTGPPNMCPPAIGLYNMGPTTIRLYNMRPPTIGHYNMDRPAMDMYNMDSATIGLPNMDLPSTYLYYMGQPAIYHYNMDPPTIELASMDPQAIEVPYMDPPAIELPSMDPQAIEVPYMDPPAIELPSMDPQAIELPNMDPQATELPKNINSLPVELFCIIINLLELYDQIAMRRVCRHWMTEIEKLFDQSPKECLKLNVKGLHIEDVETEESTLDHCATKWEPRASIRQMQFDFVYQQPAIAPSKLAQISMCECRLDQCTANLFGRIFSRVQTLLIYWDIGDDEEYIDNLVLLLSQQFSELTTFGLIMSGRMTDPAALPRICAAINAHFPPLKQLHLMVPVHDETHNRELDALNELPPIGFRLIQLDQVTEAVTNLNVPSCEGLFGIMDNTSADTFTIPGNTFSAIQLGRRGKGKEFTSVKRLIMLDIDHLACAVVVFMFFPNVEQLMLVFSTPSKEIFDFKWIRALRLTMPKVTELTLVNFMLHYLTLELAQGNDDEFEGLNRVQKLTVASCDLFYQFRFDAATIPFEAAIFPGIKPRHLAHTIGVQFPGLQELNLWSGDSYLLKTGQSTWQAVERELNRELPLSLSQMAGLQVNVQLRHPVMYKHYFDLPDIIRAAHIDFTQYHADIAVDDNSVAELLHNYYLEVNPNANAIFVQLIDGLVPQEDVQELIDRYNRFFEIYGIEAHV